MPKRVKSPKREPSKPPVTKRKVKLKRGKPVTLFPVSAIIEALRKNQGRTYLAAKALGCSPTLIIERRKQHQSIRDAVRESRGEILDISENKLLQAVKRGEAWAVQFILKTLGKKRGYVEGSKAEQTINVHNVAPVQTIDYDSMPLKLRLELLAEYQKQEAQQKLLAPPSQQTIEAQGTVIDDDE